MKQEAAEKTIKHDVRIGKKEGAGDIYFVEDIVIDKNKSGHNPTITWSSDDTEFEIWFPRDRNPVTGIPFLRRLSANSRGRRVIRHFKNLKNLEPGVYHYTIFCKKNNSMAEGNSPPRMIIMR